MNCFWDDGVGKIFDLCFRFFLDWVFLFFKFILRCLFLKFKLFVLGGFLGGGFLEGGLFLCIVFWELLIECDLFIGFILFFMKFFDDGVLKVLG